MDYNEMVEALGNNQEEAIDRNYERLVEILTEYTDALAMDGIYDIDVDELAFFLEQKVIAL